MRERGNGCIFIQYRITGTPDSNDYDIKDEMIVTMVHVTIPNT